MKTKVIFHIPHDGNTFPEELLASVTAPSYQFMRYHNDMRDFGVRLFVPPEIKSKVICFDVSRLLCDVERFIDGSEVMDGYGMGFCYEKVYDGTVIKKLSDEQKEHTMKYYRAHHKALDDEVMDYRGNVLLLDLHSFSDKTIARGLIDKSREMPDICIGYDGKLSGQLSDSIEKMFLRDGFSVEWNFPFGGSLVPNCVLKGEAKANVFSLMIEVNKRVYFSDGVISDDAVNTIRREIAELCILLKSKMSLS